jgi:predicted O-linked N-acetylglucosamine transferase (SPINDLY family)
LLDRGIDWKAFAKLATQFGLASLAGQTLVRIASDEVPDEILEALQAITDRFRHKNASLLDELGQVLELLRNESIEAIAFSGPVLGVRGYGDVAFRPFGHLDFLVAEAEMTATISILKRRGYENGNRLSETQSALIRRLEGREIFSRKNIDAGLWAHSRLMPLGSALNIDYPGLWRRAGKTVCNGRELLTFSPEDELIVSAISGGRRRWRNLKALCDVAVLLESNRLLDWDAMMERAQRQGCRRAVLAAIWLARKYFGIGIPERVAVAADGDPIIQNLGRRVTAFWSADESLGRNNNSNAAADLLWLHDRTMQRVRCLCRTSLLPKPHHVASISLPKQFAFAYTGVRFAYDLVDVAGRKPYRRLRSGVGDLRDRLMASRLGLAIVPGSAETKRRIQAHLTARSEATRQLAADPKDPGAWWRLGIALAGLKRFEDAIAAYDKGLAVVPDGVTLWSARSDAVRALKQRRSPSIEEEPVPSPDDAEAWVRRAGFLLAYNRYDEAAAASNRALEIKPKHVLAARIGIRARLSSCDWRQREDDRRRISEHVNAGLNVITPFNHRTISDSEAENLRVARLWAKAFPRAKALWNGENYGHDKIRVAYVSGEFHDHPMTVAMAGVYEKHDKARFEFTGISLGPRDNSRMRKRVESAFDRFVHAQTMTDIEIARLMREQEIDIAVDLNGYAGSGRTGIFAHRPAPLQVNFLAYCGTMGVPFMDYIVADPILIPETNEPYYTEQVVRLPHTYMPNDNTRAVAERTPSRVEAGLPESGFVFTSHNGEHKFAPEVFGIWMNLLRAVPGSVLWLKGPHTSAIGNLRREARAQGVTPDRIVFAPRVPDPADHLARLRLADLFLDTLPYNAHGTACDALWAGLPVLTCMGNTFAGRVAASLLHAAAMPELVTSSLAEYEQAALTLAREPARLAALRAKLMRNRQAEPLFDTARFTRNLEHAYITMQARQERGMSPAAFTVPDGLNSVAA